MFKIRYTGSLYGINILSRPDDIILFQISTEVISLCLLLFFYVLCFVPMIINLQV